MNTRTRAISICILIIQTANLVHGQAGAFCTTTCKPPPPGKAGGWDCPGNAGFKNKVCKNGYGDNNPDYWDCPPSTGCPRGMNVGGPGRYKGSGVTDLGEFPTVDFMQPIPTESFVYECQNSTLFLAVYNMSLRATNHLNDPDVHMYVNTRTCVTATPGQQSGGDRFDVTTYNSCDDAGACGNCGGCNCTCRVDDPYWWNCCDDPCFACSHCCACPTLSSIIVQGTATHNGTNYGSGKNQGSCLQCNHDGWCGEPNGQMLTPTVCQCMFSDYYL